MNKRIRAVAAASLVLMTFFVAACGSDKSGSKSSPENTFQLSEFVITPPNGLQSGKVEVTANNVGGELHELVIVRAPSVDALVKKADDSVDEDQIADADLVGSIEDVAPGEQKNKTFELSAGTYVALCNLIEDMAGSSSTMDGHSMNTDPETGSGSLHVHFAEGMYATFTVS